MKRSLICVASILVLVLTGSCPKKEGSLTVNLSPEEAVAAGGQWSVDNGDWQNSGATVTGLAEGDHTVTLKDITGWSTPRPRTVTTAGGETTTVARGYLPPEPAWEPDSFTYEGVQIAPDVTVVGQDQLDLLVDSDTENHIYTFNAAGVQNAGLDLSEGKGLFVYGVALRRITSVQTDGNNLIVETDPVTLNEIFTDGKIGWDYGVEFNPAHVKAIEIAGKRFVPSKDGTSIDLSFDIGDYNYAIKITLDDAVSTFEFAVTKGLATGVKARLEAVGEIARFRSKDEIIFEEGETRSFDHQMNGMRGEATLSLVVAASGSDDIKLELPATIFEIPFLVGGIPVELKVRIKFVIRMEIPASASSRVKTTFTYDSSLGVKCDGVDVEVSGNAGSINFGKETNETGAPSFAAANFGVCFPRIELSVAGDTLVPWVQTAFLVGGSFTFQPACQTADALFQGAVGLDFSLLGWDIFSDSEILFEEQTELLRAGQCPKCGVSNGELEAEAQLLGSK